jgi:hypothetical protein
MTWKNGKLVYVPFCCNKNKLIWATITKKYIADHRIWLLDGMVIFHKLFPECSFVSLLDKPSASIQLANITFEYLRNVLKALPAGHAVVFVSERRVANPFKAQEQQKRVAARTPSAEQNEKMNQLLEMDMNNTNFEKSRNEIQKEFRNLASLGQILDHTLCLLLNLILLNNNPKLFMVAAATSFLAFNSSTV